MLPLWRPHESITWSSFETDNLDFKLRETTKVGDRSESIDRLLLFHDDVKVVAMVMTLPTLVRAVVDCKGRYTPSDRELSVLVLE